MVCGGKEDKVFAAQKIEYEVVVDKMFSKIIVVDKMCLEPYIGNYVCK